MSQLDGVSKIDLLSVKREIEAKIPVGFRGQEYDEIVAKIAEMEDQEMRDAAKLDFDRWRADMFQSIQSHDELMSLGRSQLAHQATAARRASWIAIAAAIAAIVSAVAAILA